MVYIRKTKTDTTTDFIQKKIIEKYKFEKLFVKRTSGKIEQMKMVELEFNDDKKITYVVLQSLSIKVDDVVTKAVPISDFIIFNKNTFDYFKNYKYFVKADFDMIEKIIQ